MAMALQPGDKRVAVDARDRRLAGGIDVGDDHLVGVVEAGAEILEQAGEARIAVRLHHRDHLCPRRPRDCQPAARSTAEISTG